MLKYLRLVNAVVTYPYNDALLRQDNPQVSFPADIGDALRAEYGVYPVQSAAAPTPPNERISYVEGAPALVDGIWRQTWVVQTMSLAQWRATLSCSRYQFWRALRAHGLRDAVVAWLNAEDEETQDRLRHLSRIRRPDVAFEKMRADHGYTPAQGDQFFVDARALEE